MIPSFRKPQNGTNFDSATGKLYVFAPTSVTVMRAWPPVAWQKTKARPGWHRIRSQQNLYVGDVESLLARVNGEIALLEAVPNPDETTLSRLYSLLPMRERLRFMRTIPSPAYRLAVGFRDRHWHMLSVLARCGDAAADLAESNPAVAYALASNWVFHKPAVRRPLRSARALLSPGRSQLEILQWLGFPASHSSRRLLARIIPEAISISPLLYLRDTLVDWNAAEQLAHLPRLNRGVLRIATDPNLMELMTPRLLEEIACDPREDRHACLARTLVDAVAMADLLESPVPGQRFRSGRQVLRWHDMLVEAVNRQEHQQILPEFPDPPIAGNDHIIPIRQLGELHDEGREQHNCVGAYGARIAKTKKVYIYRVLEPERCTLAITLRGNKWVRNELKLACNRNPAAGTRAAVDRWLETAQNRPGPPQPLPRRPLESDLGLDLRNSS